MINQSIILFTNIEKQDFNLQNPHQTRPTIGQRFLSSMPGSATVGIENIQRSFSKT